ncbi:MAG: imidazolonepropionase [Gammaproteobacteria bacterium]|jgi:imidazolonepropionase|nr:imidazolonepropionase [Gammaproteobacteria bacterium]
MNGQSTPRQWGALWLDVNLATMASIVPQTYGAIEDGALAVKDDRICWLGSRRDLPKETPTDIPIYRCDGRWITPGLIDCHTHLVYGGDRAREFELRLTGVSYEEIARRGGGILSTVKATREASEQELVDATRPRLQALMAEGTTTIEIKSGYGLDIETEAKMLRVARALAGTNPVTVVTTFLGAHAVPAEYADCSDDYIEFVCSEALPAIAKQGLADAVDAFCEDIGFSRSQTERVFQAAQALGLPIKLHAEQLSDLGGAQLAARYGALSADHLEYVSEEGVAALASAGVVAVLLPGAFYFLRESKRPPIDLFRKHRVPMAVATDSNPGSSPVGSLLLMLNMACTLFALTPEEALMGVTDNAARALGMADTIGTLEVGKKADFVVWDIDHPAELAYRFGFNPCYQIVKHGLTV